MTKNIQLTWGLPTTRVAGGPLDSAEILSVEVLISADAGLNYVALVDRLPTEAQELFIPDQDWGEWWFRFIVHTTDNKSSANLDFPVTVPDDSAPETVVNVQVSLT